MNSLKNRYKEYQEPKPKVVLMVNDKAACNLNCDCCYLSYEGVRNPDSVLRIIENIKDKYRVTVAGSETLTDLRYLEAYKKAGQKYILTNGILLDKKPEIFDLLREYGIEEIQMSYDFKKQKGSGGLKETMLERVVRAAKTREFWVRLACIVTQENYQDVEEMCCRVKELGADAILFIRYVKSGSARTQNKEVLTQDQVEEFFEKVDGARKRFNKDEFDIRINGNFGPKRGSRGEELAEKNKYCFAGRTIFAVAPDDNVYGCPYLMDTGTPIGKLVNEARIEISFDLCRGDRSKCLIGEIY